MQIWREQRDRCEMLLVNEPNTTRFHLPMPAWVRFCWRALNEMRGGEIFIPKLEAWRLGDLALAFSDAIRIDEQRDGDKEREYLISPHEMNYVKDIGWAYAIEPNSTLRSVMAYPPYVAPLVPDDFEYSSHTAPRLTIEELKRWITALS